MTMTVTVEQFDPPVVDAGWFSAKDARLLKEVFDRGHRYRFYHAPTVEGVVVVAYVISVEIDGDADVTMMPSLSYRWTEMFYDGASVLQDFIDGTFDFQLASVVFKTDDHGAIEPVKAGDLTTDEAVEAHVFRIGFLDVWSRNPPVMGNEAFNELESVYDPSGGSNNSGSNNSGSYEHIGAC